MSFFPKHVFFVSLLTFFSSVQAEVIIPISTCQDLKNIANNMAGHYVLIQDIDCAGVEFHAIGHTSGRPFTGILDGDNLEGGAYTISNLKIKPRSDLPVGLFVVLEEARISNLHFYMPMYKERRTKV